MGIFSHKIRDAKPNNKAIHPHMYGSTGQFKDDIHAFLIDKNT